MDQTLVDSSDAHVLSYVLPLKKRGIEVSGDAVRALFGNFERIIFKQLGPSLEPMEIETMVKEREEILLTTAAQTKEMPYADEILNELKRRYRLGLATGTMRSVVLKTLDHLGWSRIFSAVITADEIINPRPNPELLEKCIRQIRCRAGEVLSVGDTLLDLETAKNAGIKAIVVNPNLFCPMCVKDLREACNIIHSLSENAFSS